MSSEKRETVEESGAGSDLEAAGDSSDGNVNSSAIIPKKRGRPIKKKIEKLPGVRGRGRPAKIVPAGADGASPTALAMANGNKKVSAGRGRPPKAGKAKVAHAISATGKGRGRPKNASKVSTTDEENDDDLDEDEDFDNGSSDEAPKKKAKVINKSPGKRGRPKKAVEHSDENASDEDANDTEHHGAGRPPTGAVNLNIVRTGRGQGRPKKIDETKKRNSDGSPDGSPKKRGRPSISKAPTGSGARGRPKAKRASSVEELTSQDEEEHDDNNCSLKVGDYSDDEDDFATAEKKHRDASPDDIAAN